MSGVRGGFLLGDILSPGFGRTCVRWVVQGALENFWYLLMIIIIIIIISYFWRWRKINSLATGLGLTKGKDLACIFLVNSRTNQATVMESRQSCRIKPVGGSNAKERMCTALTHQRRKLYFRNFRFTVLASSILTILLRVWIFFLILTNNCHFYFTKMDIIKAEIARKRKLLEEKQLVDVSRWRGYLLASLKLLLKCNYSRGFIQNHRGFYSESACVDFDLHSKV